MTGNDTAARTIKHSGAGIFINNFMVAGSRNYIRKTTFDAPWLHVGIMENTNPEMFHTARLFAGMNIVGGGNYSLGHGFIHGYLSDMAGRHIERAVKRLNALPANEIIFYHDESLCGLEQARAMGVSIRFKPVSLLEWLLRMADGLQHQICPLNAAAAVQLPCSSRLGIDRNQLIDELFRRIGVMRTPRRYDRDNRVCCGARGYFGLMSGNTQEDAGTADALVKNNVDDAVSAGAQYMITLCPMCYAAIASVARKAGLLPLQVEALAAKAFYGEKHPDGLIFE